MPASHASGPYHVPASTSRRSRHVRTTRSAARSAGSSADQAQFGMEGVLDRLAEQVGISGWEIRKRRRHPPGEVWGPGQVMDDGCGTPRRASTRSGPTTTRPVPPARRSPRPGAQEQRSRQRLPRDLASRGPLHDDGKVEVRHGWTQDGPGRAHRALQVAAGELGLDPDRIVVIVDTTRRTRVRPDHRITRHVDGSGCGRRRLSCGESGRVRAGDQLRR